MHVFEKLKHRFFEFEALKFKIIWLKYVFVAQKIKYYKYNKPTNKAKYIVHIFIKLHEQIISF